MNLYTWKIITDGSPEMGSECILMLESGDVFRATRDKSFDYGFRISLAFNSSTEGRSGISSRPMLYMELPSPDVIKSTLQSSRHRVFFTENPPKFLIRDNLSAKSRFPIVDKDDLIQSDSFQSDSRPQFLTSPGHESHIFNLFNPVDEIYKIFRDNNLPPILTGNFIVHPVYLVQQIFNSTVPVYLDLSLFRWFPAYYSAPPEGPLLIITKDASFYIAYPVISTKEISFWVKNIEGDWSYQVNLPEMFASLSSKL